jgi:hypothetical protein
MLKNPYISAELKNKIVNERIKRIAHTSSRIIQKYNLPNLGKDIIGHILTPFGEVAYGVQKSFNSIFKEESDRNKFLGNGIKISAPYEDSKNHKIKVDVGFVRDKDTLLRKTDPNPKVENPVCSYDDNDLFKNYLG